MVHTSIKFKHLQENAKEEHYGIESVWKNDIVEVSECAINELNEATELNKDHAHLKGYFDFETWGLRHFWHLSYWLVLVHPYHVTNEEQEEVRLVDNVHQVRLS